MTEDSSSKKDEARWLIDAIGSYDTHDATNAMRTYNFLDEAFKFFNRELFDDRLPNLH